jgi:hypothetical protein
MGWHEAKGVKIQRTLFGDVLHVCEHMDVIPIFEKKRLLPSHTLSNMRNDIGHGQLSLGSEDSLYISVLYQFIEVHRNLCQRVIADFGLGLKSVNVQGVASDLMVEITENGSRLKSVKRLWIWVAIDCRK